jgi:hypothetical protein
MRALKQWLGSDVNAPTTLAIAVSKELGRVLGEESATLLASADSPATLGGEMGRLLGSACVEVALLIFGY